MRITNKTKNIIKISVSILLLFGLILGAVALFSSKDDSDMKEIDPSFSIGAINAVGDYKESEYSIFTEESFECSGGLKVEVDFINQITYQVFFYDETDNFVSASEEYKAGAEFTVPEGATRARIMITPSELDENGKVKELGFFDKIKYSGQITVKVAIAEEEAAPDDLDPTVPSAALRTYSVMTA